jgi:hypothetical protein
MTSDKSKKVDREEWCIVKYHNAYLHLEPKEREGKPPYELFIRKVYQWEAQASFYPYKWEYAARGFKSKTEALRFIKLFKEEG